MATLRVVEQTATTIHLEVATSNGMVEIVADFAWFPEAKRLVFDRAHLEGARSGVLGRSGLNEVKAALADFGRQYGAEAVFFGGALRTSGRLVGKMPAVVLIHCS